MYLSYEWLKKYIDLKDEDIFTELSLHTAEVEGFEKKGGIENVVVGYVEKLEAHPDADKLRVATVDIGTDTPAQIVCGAPNVAEGKKFPVALPGAILPGGFEIKPTELRGVLSQGMLCAEFELGLTEEKQDGIWELSDDAPIGADFFSYIGKRDTVLEIDNKSITNRPDLFGHYGIAREMSVIYKKDLVPYHSEEISNNSSLPELNIKVTHPETTKRLICVEIDNIKPTSSPNWLKSALENVEEKSINSIVDVTNYIMLDIGQPMHAFDVGKLPSSNMQVSFPDKEHVVTTLDGSEITIDDKVLIVADQETNTPQALAGVIGLQTSAIDENTSKIILFVDAFAPTTIRKTTHRYHIHTEGARRQEKNLDTETTYIAFQKALHLLLELHPEATITSQILDIYPEQQQEVTIDTSYSFLIQRAGIELEKEYIDTTLTGLGFELQSNGDNLTIKVPTWRSTGDVSIPEDIVEELTRIYGFTNITPQSPEVAVKPMDEHPNIAVIERMRDLCSKEGHMSELQSYSFYSQEKHDNGLLTTPFHSNPIRVKNTLSKEQEIMRTSLMPHLLDAVHENLKRDGYAALFELEHVYPHTVWNTDKNTSNEVPQLGCVVGSKKIQSSSQKESWDTHPFFHLKQTLTDVLSSLHMPACSFVPLREEDKDRFPWAHENKAASIMCNDTLIGVIGEIHPMALYNFDLETFTVVGAEILVPTICELKKDIEYTPVSTQPPVLRDISFVVPTNTHVGPIQEYILEMDPLITTVTLMDIYEGAQLEEHQKSVTFSLTFQDKETTLKDKRVQEIVDNLIAGLESTFAITLR